MRPEVFILRYYIVKCYGFLSLLAVRPCKARHLIYLYSINAYKSMAKMANLGLQEQRALQYSDKLLAV